MMGGEESGEDDSMAGGMSCEALLGGAAGSVLQSISEDLTRGMRAVEVRSNGRTQVILKDFQPERSLPGLILTPKEDHDDGTFFKRGFSLTEILIAVAILGMMGTMTFGTFNSAVNSREVALEIAEREHEVRLL